MHRFLAAALSFSILTGCGVVPTAGTAVQGIRQNTAEASAANKRASSLESAVKARFVAVDKDKDGSLTFAEFTKSSEKDNNIGGIGSMLGAYSWLALGSLSSQREFKVQRDEFDAVIQAAKAQRVTWASLSAALSSPFFQERASKMASEFIQKNDTNGDRRLEVSEMGDDAKRIDMNKDGVLSMTEVSDSLLKEALSRGGPASSLGMLGMVLSISMTS